MYVADMGECARTCKSKLAYAAMRHANEEVEDPGSRASRRRAEPATLPVTSPNFCHVTHLAKIGNWMPQVDHVRHPLGPSRTYLKTR